MFHDKSVGVTPIGGDGLGRDLQQKSKQVVATMPGVRRQGRGRGCGAAAAFPRRGQGESWTGIHLVPSLSTCRLARGTHLPHPGLSPRRQTLGGGWLFSERKLPGQIIQPPRAQKQTSCTTPLIFVSCHRSQDSIATVLPKSSPPPQRFRHPP